MGLQRVRHDLVTKQQIKNKQCFYIFLCLIFWKSVVEGPKKKKKVKFVYVAKSFNWHYSASEDDKKFQETLKGKMWFLLDIFFIIL